MGIEEANEAAETAVQKIDQINDTINSNIKNILPSISNKLTPIVRQMVLANYDRSGIKSRTGKLRNALSSVQIKITWDGKRPYYTVFIPDGQGKYTSGSNFYEVANSLNNKYGFWDLKSNQVEALSSKISEMIYKSLFSE